MYISRLILKNVRQFQDQAITLRPGFNLLAGENGAGKTTILRSILAAIGGTAQAGRRPGLADEDISFRTNFLQVSAELTEEYSGQVLRPVYLKHLLQKARRYGRWEKPLVLLYASNEATCGSFIGRRIKRYRSADQEDVRSQEEYCFGSA